jgi:hypothetical protein
MSPRLAVALLVAVAVTVAAPGLGCGSSDEGPRSRPEPQRLTAAERSQARSAYAAIRSYCRRLGLHLAGRGTAPDARAQRQGVDGARRLAALARRKPDAPFSASQTARQLAADTAEDLEATNCSARLVAELARGL